MQTAIPYILMRGGSSKGPYFRREDLPLDEATLSKVLIAGIGAGHRLNIDGIGGGDAVTTKVAMLSPSQHEWADIDYFFAQVAVEKHLVDYKPTCGNILAGVGPAAIEMGLIKATNDSTAVKIHAVNTGARIHSVVATCNGQVCYEGDTEIAGVPGSAAPISLSFLDVIGSATGKLFPTGNQIDTINGIAVTCMDVAMPVVMARAESFGLSGCESAQELDNHAAFFKQMEAIRMQAGVMMGLGDVSASVIPKFAILSSAKKGGSVAARYFMPWKTHPAMAVTGAQCIASCCLVPGTIAQGLLSGAQNSPAHLSIEHPSGSIDVAVDFSLADSFTLNSVGLTRTARKLARGELYIPSRIWSPS